MHEIILTKKQKADLKPLLERAASDCKKGDKGGMFAQVYDGFMTVEYLPHEKAFEIRKLMKKWYPERFEN